jgi:hypothetical protein
LRQGIVQTRALLQLGFINGIPAHQDGGGSAAPGSQRIKSISKFGRPADWERRVNFC